MRDERTAVERRQQGVCSGGCSCSVRRPRERTFSERDVYSSVPCHSASRHTSHVTRHTSHVTRHTSHVTQYRGAICIIYFFII